MQDCSITNEHTSEVEYFLVQKDARHNISGFKCTVFKSAFTGYCGHYWKKYDFAPKSYDFAPNYYDFAPNFITISHQKITISHQISQTKLLRFRTKFHYDFAPNPYVVKEVEDFVQNITGNRPNLFTACAIN